MGHRNKKMQEFTDKILRTDRDPPKETISKADKTKVNIPQAKQFSQTTASFDVPYRRYTGHQGTASQKAEANAENRAAWREHMESVKGNISAAGDTLVKDYRFWFSDL